MKKRNAEPFDIPTLPGAPLSREVVAKPVNDSVVAGRESSMTGGIIATKLMPKTYFPFDRRRRCFYNEGMNVKNFLLGLRLSSTDFERSRCWGGRSG